MQERRNPPAPEDLPRDLIEQGSKQLEAEIKVIEGWLKGLAETREDNSATIAFRKSYNDMLQSRKDLLNSLKTRKTRGTENVK